MNAVGVCDCVSSWWDRLWVKTQSVVETGHYIVSECQVMNGHCSVAECQKE